LQTSPIVPQDELLYANLTKILFNIAMFQRLRISVACPAIKVLLEVGMLVFPHKVDVFLKTCNLFRLVFFIPSEVRRTTPSLRLVAMVLGGMSDNYNEHLLHVECMLTLDVLMNSRQVLNFVGQQDGFKKIIRSLDGIIGVGCTSTAKIKMALQFPHTLQSKFVLASLSLLSKLPLCDNPTDQSVDSSRCRLARVVVQIMRQHKTQIGVQSLALCVLDKYMLPYPALYCRFRLGFGMALTCSAMQSPESHQIAQKIIRVCLS